MNDYQKILELFTDKDATREWMRKPYMIEDRVMSTNGYMLCDIPFSVVRVHYDLHPLPNNVLNVLPKEEQTILTMTKSDLDEIFTLCPQIDETEEVGKDVECKACDGIGSVDFEFDYERRTYYTESDCPICDGDGLIEKVVWKPTGNKVFNPEAVVKIHHSHFRTMGIDKIRQVCEILGCDAELISQGKDMSPSLFKIGDVKILLMPLYMNEDQKPFYIKTN